MDKNKIIRIVCIGVIVVSFAGIGVMMPGVIDKLSERGEVAQVGGDEGSGDESGDGGGLADCTKMSPIEDLTREEALKIIGDAFSAAEEAYASVQCDFVPENMVGDRDFAEYTVTVADLRDFKPADFRISMDISEDMTVDESGGYYFVVTGRQKAWGGGSTENIWGRAVVFDDGDLTYGNTGLVFLRKDERFVGDVLRASAYSSVGETSRFTGASLYSYSLESIDDNYVFTFSYLSLDFMKLFGGVGQINIMQQAWTIDKATGKTVLDEQGATAAVEPLKTYELTEDEFAGLKEIAGHSS